MGKLRKPFLIGDTVEKKIENVERVLAGLATGMQSKVITITPPIPISHYSLRAKANEVFFYYIAPSDCSITKVASYCNKVSGVDNVDLRLSVENELGDFTYKINLPFGPVSNHDVEFKLPAGSRVKLSIASPDEVENFWFGLLLVFDRRSYNYEKQKLDQLRDLFTSDIEGLNDLEQVE